MQENFHVQREQRMLFLDENLILDKLFYVKQYLFILAQKQLLSRDYFVQSD